MNSKIVVLISTYNGINFLQEQLDSVFVQQYVDPLIFIRDDGSTDGTVDILNEYQQQGKLQWYTGENLRPAKSFMHLLSNAPKAEFYAFCDQDDVWLKDKLKVAIERIKDVKTPAMYCSDTRLVDAYLHDLGSGGIKADGTFIESLISNPVTGCTMVFNKALRDVVVLYYPDFIDMHDWWIYRICMAIGGYFYFDKTPHIKYRQHANNVIGGQGSRWRSGKRRLNYFLYPSDGVRFLMAKELQKGFAHLMSEENRQILEMFVNYKQSFTNTIKLATSTKVKLQNQSILNTFKMAVLLRKY